MLPVLIYEPNEADRQRILCFLADCSDRQGQQFRLLSCTDKLDEAARHLRAESGVLLLIIGVTGTEARSAAALEQLCAECNRDNYALYWLHDSGDLPKVASACLHPAGFIIPPPQEQQFCRVIRRIYEDYEALSEAPVDTFLALQSGGSVYRLPVGQILYIEAFDKKLNIWTKRQCLTVYDKLAEVERRLGARFVRCHRSYLVNYTKMERADFAKMELLLTDGTRLPLSRSGKEALKQRMKQETDEA